MMNMLVNNPVAISEKELRAMARDVKNGIKNIFLHWTAGHYGQVYDDYHLCIDRDGTVYVNCRHFLEYKTHTWMRNHSAIGIALCCGVDAECWLPCCGDGSTTGRRKFPSARSRTAP
jgi:hypothetical protein